MEAVNRVLRTPYVFIIALLVTIACIFGFNDLQARLGAPILDMDPNYDKDFVMARFLGFGEAGRMLYARATITLDLVFPIANTVLYASLIAFGIKGLDWRGARYLPLITLIPFALDIAENLQIRNLLLAFPDMTEAQVATASALTAWKFIAFRIMFLCVLAGLVRRGVLRFRS